MNPHELSNFLLDTFSFGEDWWIWPLILVYIPIQLAISSFFATIDNAGK